MEANKICIVLLLYAYLFNSRQRDECRRCDFFCVKILRCVNEGSRPCVENISVRVRVYLCEFKITITATQGTSKRKPTIFRVYFFLIILEAK